MVSTAWSGAHDADLVCVLLDAREGLDEEADAILTKVATERHLRSIALPGISSGIFGYPRDAAATAILAECQHFCTQVTTSRQASSSLRRIVLLNIDAPTTASFVRALRRSASGVVRPPPSSAKNAGIAPATASNDAAFSPSSVAVARRGRPVPADLRAHKAAGVLFTRVRRNALEVLVGIEDRLADSPPGLFLNLLGGKTHEGESSAQTAAREVSEETAGLLQQPQLLQAIQARSGSLWLPFAKYALYVIHATDDATQALPATYAKRTGGKRTLEHAHLVWVRWTDVVGGAGAPSAKVQTRHGAYSLSQFLRAVLRSDRAAVERLMEQPTRRHVVEMDRQRLRKMETQTDDELLSEMLPDDWRLRLATPKAPPPSPIQIVPASDPAYHETLQQLPPNLAGRAVSVRRVCVSARQADSEAELQRLQRVATPDQEEGEKPKRLPSVVVEEKHPLFHGTPERWRATAIALNGFDLSVSLHGRRLGNGVYSSTDPNLALGYTKAGGSSDARDRRDQLPASERQHHWVRHARARVPQRESRAPAHDCRLCGLGRT